MKVDFRSQAEWVAFHHRRYNNVPISIVQKLLSSLDRDFLDVLGKSSMHAVPVATRLDAKRSSFVFEPMPDSVLTYARMRVSTLSKAALRVRRSLWRILMAKQSWY